MGFDCYMKVVGECSFREFLLANRNVYEQDAIDAAKLFAKSIKDRFAFITKIHEVEFHDFILSFNNDDDDNNDNNDDDNDDNNSLIFIELLLLAIDEKDPELNRYLAIFDGVENLSIDINKVNITICYESSYKGSEKLDIDFAEINDNINDLKKLYPSIKIFTNLGMD